MATLLVKWSERRRWLRARWGWVVTAATCLNFFFVMGFLLTFSIVFVSLQEEFDSSATETAWIGSIPFGLCCIISPMVNIALELLGPRLVTIAGIAISAGGLIVTSFMPSLSPMFVTYSLAYGVGAGAIMFGGFGLLLRYFPLQNSTRAVVMPMACANLGMFTLGPLVFFLKTRCGWRTMLRVMGSLMLVVTVPVCALTYVGPDTGKASAVSEEPDDDSDEGNQDIVVSTRDETESTNNKLKTRAGGVDDGDGGGYDDMIGGDEGREKSRFIPKLACEKHDIIQLMDESDSNTGLQDKRNNCTTECYEKLENEKKSESLKFDKERSAGRKRPIVRGQSIRILVALTHPDVLFLAFSVLGYGLVNSFVIVQMGNFMLSLGLTERNGTQAMVVMGVSLMVGKVVLVLFADRAPFPKLGFFLIASVLGVASLLCLLRVRSLPAMLAATAVLGLAVMSTADSLPYSICNHVFGVDKGTETLAIVSFFHGTGFISASLLGESVDRTGSYDLALYACIGIYALSGLLCVLVPVYQRCFVRDRPVMAVWIGRRTIRSDGSAVHARDESGASLTTRTPKYEIVDRVSTV